MPRTARGWEITPKELRDWTLHEDDRVLVLNKPAHVVCHPAKTGPWSALASACREYLGLERVHLPVRLDRETSGVVVVAKDRATGASLHHAVIRGRFRKVYLAIVTGMLVAPRTVEASIGHDARAEYSSRQTVVGEGGRLAVTEFEPIAAGREFTLARVTPRTGRMHQIRVHAAHIGHPIVGDKLYGLDPRWMLEFVRHGFTAEMARELYLDRQALHAAELTFEMGGGDVEYRAPLAEDLVEFAARHGLAGQPGDL